MAVKLKTPKRETTTTERDQKVVALKRPQPKVVDPNLHIRGGGGGGRGGGGGVVQTLR